MGSAAVFGALVKRSQQIMTQRFTIPFVLACGIAAPVAFGQQMADKGELGVYQVRTNFYMLVGAGANIGVQIGEDGVVLVDAGSAAMSSKVIAAIKKLTPQPIRYIIDTNADPDHVGGNEALAKAGENLTANTNTGPGGTVREGASILATEDVLNRMTAPSGKTAPYASGAWPTETFFQAEKAMYLNDEGIEVIRETAHSDGDVIVFFRRSDVIMAGDILDTTRFPVIDVERGGSIQGEIDALNQLIKMAIPSIPLAWKDGGTFVIPSHGFICDQPDLVEYRDTIVIIRDVIQDLIKQGKTLEQIQAANPTQGYRSRYGTDTGTWTTNMFVEAVYKSLTAKK
jgi:glyoxylase-like metal-dependent hydrolase (beta-lactamase superfamily II)